MWVRIPRGSWVSICCECCVLWSRRLRRANHLSRGVLPTVVCRCVWSRNLVKEAMAHWGLSRQTKKKVLNEYDNHFLGPFAWSQKAPISFVLLSVCLSGYRICQLASQWSGFRKIWYVWLLWESVKKVQIWLKSGKSIGHLCEELSVFHIVGCGVLYLGQH
jgi:hypothetical protein